MRCIIMYLKYTTMHKLTNHPLARVWYRGIANRYNAVIICIKACSAHFERRNSINVIDFYRVGNIAIVMAFNLNKRICCARGFFFAPLKKCGNSNENYNNVFHVMDFVNPKIVNI